MNMNCISKKMYSRWDGDMGGTVVVEPNRPELPCPHHAH